MTLTRVVAIALLYLTACVSPSSPSTRPNNEAAAYFEQVRNYYLGRSSGRDTVCAPRYETEAGLVEKFMRSPWKMEIIPISSNEVVLVLRDGSDLLSVNIWLERGVCKEHTISVLIADPPPFSTKQ